MLMRPFLPYSSHAKSEREKEKKKIHVNSVISAQVSNNLRDAEPLL